MNFLKRKKGQAAIEFLMTYGWMLLVVLIVGALIFSFVDFGSLLPNKLDLSGNLRASATESFVSSTNKNATIIFTYSGTKQVKINATDGLITSSITTSETCGSINVKNVDTNIGTPGSGAITISSVPDIVFINGQTGVMIFDCTNINNNAGPLQNDVLEGKIRIFTKSVKTGVKTPSSGPLRLSVTE